MTRTPGRLASCLLPLATYPRHGCVIVIQQSYGYASFLFLAMARIYDHSQQNEASRPC
ncbi:MAG: hypothetical protein U0M19_00370 [Caecibacter sp.]|nr:hypothetical protein [Caecibacter sp.]